MLLRKYFTAVHRGRGAVTPIFFRLTAVWTKRLFSAAHDGSGCEEQTHLCQPSDPLRDSIDDVRQPHHRRCHARLMASRDRYRGAVPSQGRRGRSQKGNAVRVLHQTASKQRRHGATSRPSRSSSPFRNTKTHDAIRTSLYALDKAEMLDAMLALSSALYEGEAAATAVPVSGANASNNVADYAVFSSRVPPLTSSSGLGELEGVAVTGEEAYASLDAENLMCSMDACSERCNDERDVRAVQADLGTTTSAVPPFSRTAVAHPSTAGTSSSSIMATFASPDVPLERKLLQFMDLCSSTSPKSHLGGDNSDAASQRPWNGGAGVRVGNCRSDCTASSVATAWTSSTAAALVLPGLDMKAILAHGVLENRHLRGLSLVRCDFSLVRWSHVTLEDCDLSRSLFYRVELDNVIFRRCNFTGCILKGVQCNPSLSPTTHFEDCDFRLAAVGLLCIPHGSQRSGQGEDQGQGISSSNHRSGPSVCFLRCNFDLSDFQFSQGLEKCRFVRCSNTHLASRFPLRARGSVS
ncbi:hypothetical protein LPMP_260680 [Leishmania panamensis]|uniref:Pentapeptide repeat protein n=1 Tax=Leishmania panamensis TaxID=5679 RepID=A0A088RSV4_LEIPA|nr:hypothetical protein LPMP_260680 [Leishmania panamensis]AIN99182.1 hypothetical protein LPMP_260680 [Leishmania panamensis]